MDKVTVTAIPSGVRDEWEVTIEVTVPAENAVVAAQWALSALEDLQ